MAINFFDLIDGFFKGVVYFFYNIVETLFTLVRKPVLGPLLLHRRNFQLKERQLGGLTFLFLSFLALYAALFAIMISPAGESGPGEGKTIEVRLAALSSIEEGWFWIVFAASIAATIVVDGSLRILLYALGIAPATRRRRILASTEFSLIWPILLLMIACYFWPGGLYHGGAYLSRVARIALDFWWLAPMEVAALTPAAILFGRALRTSKGRSRKFAAPISLATAAAVFLAAGGAGAFVGSLASSTWSRKAWTDSSKSLVLVDTSCELMDSSLVVGATFWNRSDKPQVERIGDYALVVDDAVSEFGPPRPNVRKREYRLQLADSASMRFVLSPGQTRELRFVSSNYKYEADDIGKFCTFGALWAHSNLRMTTMISPAISVTR